MQKKVLIAIIIVVAVVLLIAAASLSKQKAPASGSQSESQTPQTSQPPASSGEEPPAQTPSVSLKTCTELSGDVCTAAEECPGTWVEASDSFSCCSETCTSGEGLEIDLFETNTENEDMGELT